MFARSKPTMPEHQCPQCRCDVAVRLAVAYRGGSAWGELRACVRCGAQYAAPYAGGATIAARGAAPAAAVAGDGGARDGRAESWLESLVGPEGD